MMNYSDVGNWISLIAEDYGLEYRLDPGYGGAGYIIISNTNDERAVEVDYYNNKIMVYYFHNFGNQSITDCVEHDLRSPNSLTKVEDWIKRLL